MTTLKRTKGDLTERDIAELKSSLVGALQKVVHEQLAVLEPNVQARPHVARAKIRSEERIEIAVRMKREGFTLDEIARALGCSKAQAARLASGSASGVG